MKVTVFDAGYYLVEQGACLVSGQAAAGHDVVEQFPAGDVLHDHEYVRGRVDDLVQADDVWVRAHLEYVDLPPHLLCHLHVLDAALVQDLHGYFLSSHHVMRHYAEHRRNKYMHRQAVKQ